MSDIYDVRNLAKYKPWYKTCTTKTILSDKNAEYLVNISADRYERAIKCFRDRYDFVKRSTHNGYIPANDIAKLPYFGRKGTGYILVTHKNSNKVNWDYYISDREALY